MDSGKCFSSSFCFGCPSLTFLRLQSPIGEYISVLDLSSFRVCGYQPRRAVVMGWFQEKTPLPGHRGRLTYEINVCPRTILRRIVECVPSSSSSRHSFSSTNQKDTSRKAKRGLNLSFLIGVESEFILLKQTNPIIEAVNNHTWSNSPALPSGSVEAKSWRKSRMA